MREVVSAQHYATALSLSVLLALEKGDVGKAKSQLARQVGEYHHSWAEYDGLLPEQAKLLPMIRELASDSPALRDELARKPE